MERTYDSITFDCYGTLIDWETGISDAISSAAASDGVKLVRNEIVAAYHEVEPTIQAAEYVPYRDVLAATAVAVGARLSWYVDEGRAGFLADSLRDWRPFAETNGALEQLKRAGYQLGILSNVDDDLLAGTLRNLSVEFDFVVTAEKVRSYKPAHGHFEQAREIIGESSWLHAAQSWLHDVLPASAMGIPVAWVNRKAESRQDDASPVVEVATLSGLVDWMIGAG